MSGGVFRIVFPVGVPDGLRVALLRASLAVTPDLRMEEIERLDPLDHLDDAFDLVLHFGDAPAGDWVSNVLVRVPLVPLASEGYLAEFGRPSCATDLAEHRILSWRIGRSIPTVWPLRAGGSLDVAPIFCSRNGQVLHRMAQMGVGILLGDPNPAVLALPIPLVPILADEIGAELTLRSLTRPAGRHDARASAIVDTLESLIHKRAR